MEKGIISSIKSVRRFSNYTYTMINDKSVQVFTSKFKLNLYDIVNYDPIEKTIERTDERGDKALFDSYVDKLISKLDKSEISDERIKKMEPYLRDDAKSILRNLLSGSPIMVRFHMDGDGASGAIALYEAFLKVGDKFGIKRWNTAWNPNKGISYDLYLFNLDQNYLNNFESIEKPIIFLTDFGTSPESEDTINKCKSDCNYRIIWLEHHPIYDGFPKDKIFSYVNPWMYGMDSNVTAGFLTAEFASLIGGEFYHDLEGASLISDHSNFADLKDQKLVDLATVLDALTVSEFYGRDNYRISPSYLLNVLNDKIEFDHVLNVAKSELNESLSIGVKKSKKYALDDGVNLYALDYSFIADRNYEYMKHGRYTTKLHDELERVHGSSNITAVYFKKFISIRVSDSIVEKVKLLKSIKELEDEGLICNGGGHNEAASIKIREGSDIEPIILSLISKFNDNIKDYNSSD